MISPSRQCQQEVIEFLRQPSSYPALTGGSRGDVSVIETHAALVFLAGEDAYKIKKDIVYSYLDFSSLEKRRLACVRELAVNQPHAPQIYLGVVAITRETDGHLEISGAGPAVEWAVHMQRFCDDDLLARALKSRHFKPAFFDSLADEIIRYHGTAEKFFSGQGYAKMAAIVEQLCQAFEVIPDLLNGQEVERFSELAGARLKQARDCLNDRSRQGCIRRCHGDLHLENIVVIDNAPVLFDAIEFNEEIATIDVLYDLAFLLMDLGHQSFNNVANQILNRYLAGTADEDNIAGMRALPLFLGCRAAIRAMVISSRIKQAHSAVRGRDHLELQNYFHAALDFLKTEDPQLIAVGGFSGTGKTTVARGLAPCIGHFPGAVHLRTDLERKAYFEVMETTRLGPENYTSAASRAIYKRILKKAQRTLAAGKSVVVDAAFLDPHQRRAIEKVAQKASVPFIGVWLEADENTLVERVAARQNDASDATAEIVRRQIAGDAGNVGWQHINAGGSVQQTLENVKEAVKAINVID